MLDLASGRGALRRFDQAARKAGKAGGSAGWWGGRWMVPRLTRKGGGMRVLPRLRGCAAARSSRHLHATRRAARTRRLPPHAAGGGLVVRLATSCWEVSQQKASEQPQTTCSVPAPLCSVPCPPLGLRVVLRSLCWSVGAHRDALRPRCSEHRAGLCSRFACPKPNPVMVISRHVDKH